MMLSILTKRLCPLVSLALAFGCGKKINDPKTTSGDNTQGQTTELPATLTIQLNTSQASSKTYTMPKNAWLNLPIKLLAREGSAIGKRVKIYYNLFASGDYDFHCFYKSTSVATELAFEKCENSDDIVIISNPADLERMDIPIDKGTTIKMDLTSGSGPGVKIESSYEVDWK